MSNSSARARRRRPGPAAALGALVWAAMALHAVLPDSGPLVVIAHATFGWWWLPVLALLAAATLARDRLGIGLAGTALAALVVATLSGPSGAPEPADGRPLRVAVANVYSANPDAGALIADLLAEEPDVVALLEVSPDLDLSALDAARWPVRSVIPRADNFGIALFAPAGASPVVEDSASGVPWLRTTVRYRGAEIDVIAAHTLPPVRALNHAVWTEQLASLAGAAGPRRTVVLGDLNLTPHNPTFAALREAGWADAVAARSRPARTWTPFRAGPDILRLDHVLIAGGVGARSAKALPRRGSDHRALIADLVVPPTATAHAATAPSTERPRVHVDRAARVLSVVDASGTVVHAEPIGIGRGGLVEKRSMEDLSTPTGTFTVDLVLTRDGAHDAVDPAARARFADTPDYARLLDGEPGLSGLFANMSAIDFDGDGAPDRAYGDAYVGLTSDVAVTGPKMRRHSSSGTPYWYSIALHQTPDPANLGEARSGGCVHVSDALLQRLIADGTLALGAEVTIADGPPEPARSRLEVQVQGAP